MSSENKNGKVPLISKIAYGFGDVGCNFSWMFVSNFLMIFYTDVFGISMAAVSALMLFSRFWDAINDPIVGGLTDKTKSKWGRYRPWLLVAAPITAILLDSGMQSMIQSSGDLRIKQNRDGDGTVHGC